MNDFTKAWLLMICITFVMYLTSLATTHENPGSPTVITGDTQLGNISALTNQLPDPDTALPNTDSVSSDNSGNIFSDPLTVIWGWITGIPGAKYITDTIAAPGRFLTSIIGSNYPEIATIFSLLWFSFIILLTVMMLSWRG